LTRPEQLAAALERIDPSERELLLLSLKRRVPDEALARVYQVEPQELPRRRAEAIEHLADELQVQRGEELGSVLKALLEPGTWGVAELTKPGKKLVDPVVERIARRDPEAVAAAERHAPHVALALAGIAIAALVGSAGVVGATQFSDDDSSGEGSPTADHGERQFVPAKGGPPAAPFRSEPDSVSCYSIAYVTRPATLYREPGGPKLIEIPARTKWGSPRVLGVVRRRGEWLGVQAPELRNGELAWLPASRARVGCVHWSLHTDLSRRVLYVRKDGHTVRKFRVAIGSRRHPTPKGRFSVTDKLKVTDEGSPYGCCVVALSGHQTCLPSSWPGGDQLGVHATTDRASIGKRVSLGCMRTDPGHARWLLETIPLGAPIFIRS
jgi:hypothetical protein